MSIGSRIYAAMIDAGKSPGDIARHLKITESAVSQWFKKGSGPKASRLGDLAAFLSTTVDSFTQDQAGRTSTPRPPQDTPKDLIDILTARIYDPADMPEGSPEEKAVFTLIRHFKTKIPPDRR